MEVLTEAEVLERTLNTGGKREVIYNIDGFDRLETIQNSLYCSKIKQIELSCGLRLEITKATCFSPLNYDVNHEDFDFLVAKFYLSGHHGVICPQVPGIAENYLEEAGQSYLFYLPNIQEIEQYFPDDEVYLITIYIKQSFLRSYYRDLNLVPQAIAPLLETGRSPCFHLPIGNITPAMQTVLWQIINTPYRSTLQRMYLESKILELLVLQLSQLLEVEKKPQKYISFKGDEIDKIYQAKEILINNITEPPTLINLSKQVEIHHMKLKQGFRELFGTTPFAYLRNYRLEMAQNLLLESDMSVLAVASAVGYANSSHFAAAFKEKFGISPKDCKQLTIVNE